MTLTIASWPGYGPTQNTFLRVFLDGLAAADCSVVSLHNIDDMASLEDIDILLLHWPQRVFWESASRREVPVKIARLLSLIRKRPSSTKVVWLAHDLRPHDAKGLQRALWRPLMSGVVRELDGFVTLTAGTVSILEATYSQLITKPRLALRHPAYPDQSLPQPEVDALRRSEGLEPHHRVIGYCGQLRNNKGLDVLARAFRDVQMADVRLFVAGSATQSAAGVVDELQRHAAADDRIRLKIGDLDDDAFRSALLTCDLIAAPFREYLHSGSLIHALSASRPVLTPVTPFATDLLDDLGPRWVRLYEGELSSSQLEEAAVVPRPTGLCLTSDFDADLIGQKLALWMRMVLDGQEPR